MDRIRVGSLWTIAWALAVSSALLSAVPSEAFGGENRSAGAQLHLAQASQPTPTTFTFQANWVNPTQYADGTALAATDITQTRLEYGTCTGSGSTLDVGTVQGQFIAQGGLQHATSPALTAGTYCVRAYTTAKGLESVASSPAATITFAVPQAPPNAPARVTVTAVVSSGAPSSFTAKQGVTLFA